MQKFDIFIRGINPDRKDETDTIRLHAAKALQISVSELDDLLAHPSTCIRRDASEDEAKNYQRTLNKLGLISLYSPVKHQTNLELVPIAEDIVETSIFCPSCEHEIEFEEDGSVPEKCPKCGITIVKFLEQKKKTDERDAIKAKLLTSQTVLQIKAIKKQEEDDEKQRKLELEKEVLDELLGVHAMSKKPLNVKLLIIGGGLAVIVAGASYFLTSSEPPPAPPKTSASTPSLATGSETESAGSSVKTATTTQTKTTAAPLTAQQAMQKTHDQAAQVLQGFGLNPDAFANAGSSESGAMPATTEENVPDILASIEENAGSSENGAMLAPTEEKVPNTLTSVATATNPATPVSVSAVKTPPLNTQEIFAILNKDIAWDRFLAQNSKILLERQLPEKAVKLSKFIVAHDVYVDTLGELLRAAQQAKQTKLVDDYLMALETRLTPLPPEQQAVYFAQAGSYLPIENHSNLLLARAERLLVSLPKPELQLNTILKLAVIYSKSGNIAVANGYFNKIHGLLTPITDADIQVELRASVARAYQEINNSPVAAQWLSSTAPQLKQIKSETISALITSYAVCNQWQSVLDVLKQVGAKDHYDLWVYQAIGASLKAGFIANALELQKTLDAPVYKVLANIEIAEYSPAMANELVGNTTKILNEQLTTAAEKTIVAGRLVNYYGKLKNTEKTKMFIAATQAALAKLPISDEKDEIINTVVAQFLHGFQAEEAGNLLTGIQSSTLKTRLNTAVTRLANVSELLK